jgi:hypothetical protein|tara:strand:+ start:120 stop:449 length:330 start_codon:yes stop_codon:yes gene_type:complete
MTSLHELTRQRELLKIQQADIDLKIADAQEKKAQISVEDLLHTLQHGLDIRKDCMSRVKNKKIPRGSDGRTMHLAHTCTLGTFEQIIQILKQQQERIKELEEIHFKKLP